MSLASANVLAVYDNVHGVAKAGGNPGATRRNMRLKKLEAHRTIPKDTRAPAVVQKADEDLRQQEVEMGDDQQNNEKHVDAAGSPANGSGPEAPAAGPQAAAGPADADAPGSAPPAAGNGDAPVPRTKAKSARVSKKKSKK